MEMCLRQAYFLTPKLQDNFGNWKYSNCKAAPADKKKNKQTLLYFCAVFGWKKKQIQITSFTEVSIDEISH